MQGIKPVLSNTRSPAKLGGCSQARTSLLYQATSDGTRGMASGCARGALGWTLGKNYSQKRLFSLGTACPGHWWVTPLECGHGTSCHGLVVVARGWWLDLMILKVFCDMNDSVMLWSAARTLQWKLSHQLTQLKQNQIPSSRCLACNKPWVILEWPAHLSLESQQARVAFDPAWHVSAQLCVTLTANILTACSETCSSQWDMSRAAI